MDGNDINWTAGTIADRSGKGNTGTLVGLNQRSAAQGKFSQALSFDGSTSNIATSLTNLNFSSGTISWWMKPAAAYNTSALRGIWGQMTSGNTTPEFSCQVFVDNNWYCGWNGASDTRVTFSAAAVNYPLNTWAFYTLVWTGSGTTLYQNGVSIGTNGTAPAVSNIANAFVLGRQGSAAGNFFPGAIDDFRIYNRALSPTEVQALYHLGTALVRPN